MCEEYTPEQTEKMEKLKGKYNFNDLRLFLKKFNLQFCVGNYSDILDEDLFKYNAGFKKEFRVFDERRYKKIVYAMEVLDNLRHKRYVTPLPEEEVKKVTQIATDYANYWDISLKKLIRNYENTEEFFDEAMSYATYYCTYDADKVQIFEHRSSPESLIIESAEEWQQHLKLLDKQKTAQKQMEL